eukprot:5004314-Pyramimonas_sp.AAC.1
MKKARPSPSPAFQALVKEAKAHKKGKPKGTLGGDRLRSMSHPVLGTPKVTYASQKSCICSVDPVTKKPKLFLE